MLRAAESTKGLGKKGLQPQRLAARTVNPIQQIIPPTQSRTPELCVSSRKAIGLMATGRR
jgi:hypothetical protein